jgi:hypothetical protein
MAWVVISCGKKNLLRGEMPGREFKAGWWEGDKFLEG